MTRFALPMTLVLAFMMACAPAATAQSRSHLTMIIEIPQAPITKAAAPLALQGETHFTGDLLQYQHTNGIPIAYTVTKLPPWASVVVSPATDVIPSPGTPSGPSFSAARTFTVVVTLDPAFAQDPEFPRRIATDVEITVTQGATMLGAPASGKVSFPLQVNLPEPEPCHVDEGALLAEAVATYNAHQAAQPAPADEMTVQNADVTRLPGSALALATFGLVGAAVGFVAQRRLRR